MYTAIYLPNNKHNKDGFDTEDEAIQFVVGNCICDTCKDMGWESRCAAEWMVIETEKLKECENLGDILEAGGCERIE